MSLTTSYFAVSRRLKGTKISIARYNPPRIVSGIEIRTSFAPSSDLLWSYKKSEINWEQYRKRYYTEQKRHYKENPRDFSDLLKRATSNDIILLCYERFEGRRTKCHRHLIYRILQQVAEIEDYQVEFIDETFPK